MDIQDGAMQLQDRTKMGEWKTAPEMEIEVQDPQAIEGGADIETIANTIF